MNSQVHYERVKYWLTTDNENHCFDSNPLNKEIMTVNADYINYAISHFYTRTVQVDIVVSRLNRERTRVETVVTDDAHFKLEIARCSFEKFAGLLKTNDVEYISFRLADK
ncbi:MAG: hypothetical protein NDI69_09150 [Bacteriovoracaceae bacterium]|nr:hypothetical protein [Bacteriovoracaceae bacterium]